MEINLNTDKNITAEIIADSLSPDGNRLTSFVVQFPRIVLAEFNTHRMLSRNSASSRAVPFDKMMQRVMSNPFIPLAWQKDHKGMQGTEYHTIEKHISLFKGNWLKARDNAVNSARDLSNGIFESKGFGAPKDKTAEGITKQIVNRLLEPFMYHTAIVTASEWQNFFALRAHPMAEIHIANLAEKMLNAYNESAPKNLKPGEWHIPFGDKMDDEKVDKVASEWSKEYQGQFMGAKIKIATARCARVSYINYEGKDDYEADIKLHDTLSRSGHWSCFEHCARVMDDKELESYISTNYTDSKNPDNWSGQMETGWLGNFRGFIQYRKMFASENAKDSRVVLK